MSIVFDFFSGIGGFHHALLSSNSNEKENKKTSIKKIFPFDVNTNANIIYNHNFSISPSTCTLESLKLNEYNKLCEKHGIVGSEIIWFMSPPCQPFTSLGNQRDLDDERTTGFRNLIDNILLNTSHPPDYLILENVKNFEVKILRLI